MIPEKNYIDLYSITRKILEKKNAYSVFGIGSFVIDDEEVNKGNKEVIFILMGMDHSFIILTNDWIYRLLLYFVNIVDNNNDRRCGRIIRLVSDPKLV